MNGEITEDIQGLTYNNIKKLKVYYSDKIRL